MTKFMSIDMSAKGLEKLKEGSPESYNTKNKLYIRIGGGELPDALVISEYINQTYNEMYVYSAESAGIVPFLLFRNRKNLYLSKNAVILIHPARVWATRDMDYKISECKGLCESIRNTDRIYKNILKDPKNNVPNIIKACMNKSFEGNAEYFLSAQELKDYFNLF